MDADENPFESGPDPMNPSEPAALDAVEESMPLLRADEEAQPEETPGEAEAMGAESGVENAQDDESPAIEAWQPDPDKLLCAILFATQEFLTARALRDIMGDEWELPRLRQLVKAVNQRFQAGDHPFEVVEVDATFRLRTQTRYFPWVKKLFKEAVPRRLSQAGLETLAIIAYKQPITKAEVEAIRGVNVDGALKSLLDKKLVDIHRRSEAMGGAFTYITTREFLRYFGISKVPDDLPRLSEFEQIVNAQALIPQIGPRGEVQQYEQPEEDAEQMALGMDH